MAIHTLLEQRLHDAITRTIGPEHGAVDPLLRITTNPEFGDYQANVAMSLAKLLKRQPRELAEDLVRAFDATGLCDEAPTIAGPGFINLRLSDGLVERELHALEQDARCGVGPAPTKQVVVIDYSAPNVAKEMHVGHLRSTVIGDCIARVLDFVGHDVVRQNHIGDWGTQFGMLIEYMLDEGLTGATEHSVSDLNSLYQAAKSKFDSDPEFAERSRGRVVLLQGGDATALAVWQQLIDESKRHFASVYERLGVLLTEADVCPESFFNSRLGDVVELLQKRGLAVESDGATCVFPDGFKGRDNEPLPLIVRKSDGGYNYATTDLAAVRYRTQELRAQRVIYVVDARQRQHFAMVFQVASDMGWLDHGARLEHVPFGTILGEDNRPFKTRSGGTVRLIELLDEAIERAAAISGEKAAEFDAPTRAAIAKAVGMGAVKYADLSNERVKDYVFSWDRMLALQGNTAPYLQNAYVRIQSLFRKAAERGFAIPADPGSLVVQAPEERAMAMKLFQFPAVVEAVEASLEPHRLCTYLYELASQYHQFYERCPVLTADDEATRSSRLRLSAIVGKTLRTGLALLGIEVVDRM